MIIAKCTECNQQPSLRISNGNRAFYCHLCNKQGTFYANYANAVESWNTLNTPIVKTFIKRSKKAQQ